MNREEVLCEMESLLFLLKQDAYKVSQHYAKQVQQLNESVELKLALTDMEQGEEKRLA